MSSTVARTCTELVVDIDSGLILTKSQPLSAFDHLRAYVLLGDAGSGKTTEFKRESEALGDSAEFLSARDFITFDADSHPEWQEKTLFIDGLDEMRAGTSDSLTPLDQIRRRLDRLGKPSFRLSCREADWLGANDRQNLDTVSPDSQITVLRLNPLDDDGIRALLTSLDLPGDVEEFIDRARRRGLGAILHNPQTLTLLADAVEQGGDWPDSRQQTFELACQKMASEWNEEHLERADHTSSDVTMDAAGYLCALQLLAGTEGYSMSRRLDSALFPSVEELQDPPNQLPDNSLRQALTTRLFTGVVERRVSPIHRHIAEFLAGRHLAKLIESGLPVERVMALMTSPSDQRVVTVLRGLSAWLAAHSPTARRRLIDLDPVGVGLYGDIKGLPPDEKQQLLESLAAFADQGQLFGHERPDDHGGWHVGSTAQAFRSLASDDMVPAFKELFTKPIADFRDDRVLEFVLEVLSQADVPDLNSLGVLSPDLEALLRDPAKPTLVKVSALDALLHIPPSGQKKDRTLLQILHEIQDGALPDPDGQLRGTILSSLYPDTLSPSEVWQIALPLNPHDISYRMRRFLDEDLLNESSGQQVAELLDALYEDASTIVPALSDTMLHNLPFDLLSRGLEECGGHTELPRLSNWLSIIGDFIDGFRWDEDKLRGIQDWLEANPHIQKAVFLAWLRQSYMDGSSEPYPWVECDALLKSSLPSDFGLWCLDNALELADTEPSVAQNLLARSHRSLLDPSISDGFSLDILRSLTRGHGDLEQRLEELCTPRPPSPELSEAQGRRRVLLQERREEERRQQLERESDLRSQVTELRGNRFFPRGLHSLAQVYFGKIGRTSQDATPDQRISEFIGDDPDPELVRGVMTALRRAVYREDIPEADETIALNLDSKFSFLSFPVLASLELLYDEDPALLDELDDTLKRNALAIHYCVSPVLNANPNRPSPWFARLLEHDHELVLEVLFQCVHAAIRARVQFPPGLRDLDNIEHTHPALACEMTTRLLISFPARAPQAQMPLLDRLLDRMLKAGKPEFEKLVEEKLSMKSMDIAQRIRWLTVGALLRPALHLVEFEEYAGKNQMRVRHLAGFLCNRLRNNWFADSPLVKNLDPQAVAAFIRLMGSSYDPMEISGMGPAFVGPEIDTSWRIQDLISLLGSKASQEANDALRILINNPRLLKWRDRFRWAEERQRILLRDATYTHPSVEQVQRTLDNGLPANATDLAALLNDHLNGIAEDIRGSNSNIWRQYWNEDRDRKPTEPRHEDTCRDALLARLQQRLPPEIDAAPEGRYVSDKRADIRVSYGEFNVPIEIKKNSHQKWRSALSDQLIAQYTTDPATSGHGTYLVLWFGADKTARSPVRNRPATPDELRELLEGDLAPDQTSKISVRVLDVTKP